MPESRGSQEQRIQAPARTIALLPCQGAQQRAPPQDSQDRVGSNRIVQKEPTLTIRLTNANYSINLFNLFYVFHKKFVLFVKSVKCCPKRSC